MKVLILFLFVIASCVTMSPREEPAKVVGDEPAAEAPAEDL